MSSLSALPPNLPDERAAQRLLDALANLEHILARARLPQTVNPAELNDLKTENITLRGRQQQAQQRLFKLIERLEQTVEDEVEQEAAA